MRSIEDWKKLGANSAKDIANKHEAIGREKERAAIVRFLRAEQTKHVRGSDDPTIGVDGRERCRAKAAVLATMAAYVERGDHLTGEDEPEDAPPGIDWIMVSEDTYVARHDGHAYRMTAHGNAFRIEQIGHLGRVIRVLAEDAEFADIDAVVTKDSRR